jgi:hypothetical protein
VRWTADKRCACLGVSCSAESPFRQPARGSALLDMESGRLESKRSDGRRSEP